MKIEWERMNAPNGGWKTNLEDSEIVCFVTETTMIESYRDSDVPTDAHEIFDPEMTADGCPDGCRAYSEGLKAHKQWIAQGWMPQDRSVPAAHIMIMHFGAKKSFTATVAKSGSMDKAEAAIEKIAKRLQPSWMTMVQDS